MTEQDRTEEAQEFDVAIEEGEGTALVVAPEGPGKLLEMAVQQDLDIDKLERLVAMKERWDAREARKAFYEALSKFQKLVPALKKDKHVHYKTKTGSVIDYDHTSLGKIQPQIRDAAAECGLSHRWEFNDGADLMEVTCVITHVDGHSERSSQSAPIDTSGNKSTIHGRQSSRTYLERSTLIGALGLMSADKDDDGRQGQVSGPTPEEAAANLPPLPEGTETKAPKPEVVTVDHNRDEYPSRGKHSERGKEPKTYRNIPQSYLNWGCSPKLGPCEMKDRIIAENAARKPVEASEEGISDAEFENSVIPQAIEKLLEHPVLSEEEVNEWKTLINNEKNPPEEWLARQESIIKGIIADKERETDKQGTLIT